MIVIRTNSKRLAPHWLVLYSSTRVTRRAWCCPLVYVRGSRGSGLLGLNASATARVIFAKEGLLSGLSVGWREFNFRPDTIHLWTVKSFWAAA